MEAEEEAESQRQQILRIADELILKLEKCAGVSRSAAAGSAAGEERLLQILRPLCLTVEEILPVLHQYAGQLEDQGCTGTAGALQRKMAHIEDDLLPVLRACLREHA